jgi:hypothetical protein
VLTGRAVVLIFSVVEPGLVPVRVTEVEVKVPVAPVGRPVSLTVIALA